MRILACGGLMGIGRDAACDDRVEGSRKLTRGELTLLLWI